MSKYLEKFRRLRVEKTRRQKPTRAEVAAEARGRELLKEVTERVKPRFADQGLHVSVHDDGIGLRVRVIRDRPDSALRYMGAAINADTAAEIEAIVTEAAERLVALGIFHQEKKC